MGDRIAVQRAPKRAPPLEIEFPPAPKRATSSSTSWQRDMILAAAQRARLYPRPRRSYADGVRLMGQEFLDPRLMDCDSDDDSEGGEGDGNNNIPPGCFSQENSKPQDANIENRQPCIPRIDPQDFKVPRLRRCPFDVATLTFVGPIHPRLNGQTRQFRRADEAMPDGDGGFDGYNWKVRFGDRGPFVLKVFWDQAPPKPPSYYALQRECQVAVVLQLMQAALARTDDVGPVLVRPHPNAWDVALENMLAFTDEHRQRNAHAQTAAADGTPQPRKRLTQMPRIRRCYGWMCITGKSLYEQLPRVWWPPTLTINSKTRKLQQDLRYTALVYEYVEEAPNDEAALEDALAFFRDAGFAHTPISLLRNWKGNVLVDLSDLVAACGWDWGRWQ